MFLDKLGQVNTLRSNLGNILSGFNGTSGEIPLLRSEVDAVPSSSLNLLRSELASPLELTTSVVKFNDFSLSLTHFGSTSVYFGRTSLSVKLTASVPVLTISVKINVLRSYFGLTSLLRVDQSTSG